MYITNPTPSFHHDRRLPCIMPSKTIKLAHPIRDVEKLSYIDLLKALALISLHVCFYQKHRMLLGLIFVILFTEFLMASENIKDIRKLPFFTLILNNDACMLFVDFRLISLCNVIYKVVTEILRVGSSWFLISYSAKSCQISS